MVRGRLLRFVSLGACGFGAGGALAGTSWPLLPRTVGLCALLVVVEGAIGGSSLGLALRDRSKVVILALLGAVGFTVGSIAAVVLAFVGMLPASEFGATNAMGAVAAGMIVGAVGAASLGVSLRDPRKLVILTLAGAVGFEVGLLAKFALEHTLRLGAVEDVLLVVGRVIGDATLGATLGYLEGAAEHVPGERMLWLGALAGVPLVAGFFVAFFILPYRGTCGEEERAAFSEFPQYGGVEKEPQPDSFAGGCAVVYETSAPPRR